MVHNTLASRSSLGRMAVLVLVAGGISLGSATLLGGCARGGSKPAMARKDPAAMAESKRLADEAAALRAQRAAVKREAMSMQERQRDLEASAAANQRKAEKLRQAAKPFEQDGSAILLAGESLCEAGDCERGCAISARGQAKLDKAAAMHAEADKLDEQAQMLMVEAGALGEQAKEKLANIE